MISCCCTYAFRMLLGSCVGHKLVCKRCGVFFSHTPNEAKASAVMTSTISNWQLTRQNPRKPRASCAQAREAPARHLAMLSRMSLAARFKQRIGNRNMHFPSFRLCPSCVAEPAVLSVGSRVCCWPRITGTHLSGKSLSGLLCERRTHCLRAIHTKTSPTEVNENEFLRHCARKSAQVPRKCGLRAQSRAKEYRTTPTCIHYTCITLFEGSVTETRICYILSYISCVTGSVHVLHTPLYTFVTHLT